MADPFGIIGLIGVAAQFIQIGVQFGLNWKDAPADIKGFTTELQTLKAVLSELNTNIVSNQDFQNAFLGKHSAILSQLESSQRESTYNMLTACRTALESLLVELQKRARGHRLGWGKLKEAFLATKTREAVEDLVRRCQMLNSLVAMDTLALGSTIYKEVTEARREQQEFHQSQSRLGQVTRDKIEGLGHWQTDREAKDERQKILDWLAPGDYAHQQSDFIERREAGTGEWFLGSDQYQAWLAGPQNSLYCPGMPGAGKTILAAIVIDDLIRRFQKDPDIGIAYIYCNYRAQEDQKVGNLLANLLRQLSQTRAPLPDEVKSLHDQFKTKRPPLKDIATALQSVVALYSRVYIIVDALDECSTSDDDRSRLLTEISRCQAQYNVNFMATSRHIPEIEVEVTEMFNNTTSLDIQARTEDLQLYLDGRTRLLPKCARHNIDLQNEVKRAVLDSVNGMFLLAQLFLESLKGKTTPRQVREALSQISLATGSDAYNQAYKDAMDRISRQSPEEEQLAIQILTWIVFAHRPLTTAELEHAIATEPGKRQLDKQNICPVEDMISVSAGLVTIDKESNVIRLVHYTAQQYFERTQEYWFPQAETLITTICMAYLSFDDFRSGYCHNHSEFRVRLEKYPLYDYAAQYWGFHARETSSFDEENLDFLKCKEKAAAAGQSMHITYYFRYAPESTDRLIPNGRQITGFHLIAFFGIKELCYHLTGAVDIDSRDEQGTTPLGYAILTKDVDFAQFLLDQGANPDLANNLGHTPLWVAVVEGHKDLVLLLLRSDRIDINAVDNERGRTPLWMAAKFGHEDIAQLLLNTEGINPDQREATSNRSPLSVAAEQHHLTIVKALVAKDSIDVHARDSDGKTPLLWAADNSLSLYKEQELEQKWIAQFWTDDINALEDASYQACRDIMNVLIDQGASLDSTDNLGRTVLSWAAEEANPVFFWLVLQKGANPWWRDNSGKTAMSIAEEAFGCDRLAYGFYIIMAGAEITSIQDVIIAWLSIPAFRTSLPIEAAKAGDVTLLSFFWERGIGVDSQDEKSRTPLSYAAGRGRQEVVRLLLDYGASINSRSTTSRTPLSYASTSEHQDVIHLLIAKGADIERYTAGLTPLMHAAARGHKHFLQTLFQESSILDKGNNDRSTIFTAAFKGDTNMIDLFVEKGIDINKADEEGRTPLLYAAANGQQAAVQLLLRQGSHVL